MTGSRCLDQPRRSLAELRLELVAEHYTASLAEHEAENSGCDTVAAHHAARIEAIDVKLRAIEGAMK